MATDAITYITNASNIRLRILAMEKDEELIVNRQELPRSYKTPLTLIRNIMKTHDCAYAVKRMLSSDSFKIVCLKEASDVKNNPIQPRKEKSTSNQLKPDHNFSLGELAQVADIKLEYAERDLAQLAVVGVTMPRILAARALVVTLKNTPDDIEKIAGVSIAVDARIATRTALYKALNNLRRMAKSELGEVAYGLFKFDGLVGLPDVEFAQRARQMHRKASVPATQALLLAEGCTTVFLDAMAALIATFILNMDAVEDAESARVMGTYERTLLGNTIYKEVAKICNAGKDYYQNIAADAVKWEDYVISN